MENREEYLSLLMKLVSNGRLWENFRDCKLIYYRDCDCNAVKNLTVIDDVVFYGLKDYPPMSNLPDGFFLIKDKFENQAYVLEHLPITSQTDAY